MSAILEVRGLHKHYGERTVLNIGQFHLTRGESCILAGSNGSGKTTLLRILAGLEMARVSEFRFNGEPVALAPYPDRLRQSIVYVHQHPYLFHTSLRHNLEYGLRCRQVPPRERSWRVAEALQWSGLTKRTATPPARLSGGEKQRAALARARVLQPEVLLLDEPTANLDQEARQQTIELIARLCSANTAIMIACHDQELIGLPGVRVLRLAGGQIDQISGTASSGQSG